MTSFFHLVFVLVGIVSTVFAYTCTDNDSASAPMIDNEGITISGCTFSTGVTINNPTTVSIVDSTFEAGLTINGDDTTPITGAINMKNVLSPKKRVTISLIASNTVIQHSTLHSLTISDSVFSEGTEVKVENSSITTEGLYLQNATFEGSATSFALLASSVKSETGDENPIRLRQTTFKDTSQMFITGSIVQSTRNAHAINFHSDTNMTSPSRYRIDYTTTMFASGSVFNFTNSTVVSNGGKAIHTYRSWRGASKTFHAFGLISGGSMVVATNTKFLSPIELYLTEGASAELDEASYEDAHVKIVGDNDDAIVIPMPSTISVDAIEFVKCRVHVPSINEPNSEEDRTWSVSVAQKFTVKHLHLNKSQRLSIHPRPNALRVTVELNNVNFEQESSLRVAGVPLKGFKLSGVIDNSSVEITNSARGEGSLTFGPKFVLTNESQLITRNLTLAQLSFSEAMFNSSTIVHFEELEVTSQGVDFTSVEADDAKVSFVRSILKSVGGVNALYMENATFINGAELFFKDAVVRSTFPRVAAIRFYGTTNRTAVTRSTYHYTPSMFDLGARLVFENTTVQANNGDGLATYKKARRGDYDHVHFGFISRGAKLLATNSRFHSFFKLHLAEGASVVLDTATYRGIQLQIKGDSEQHIVIPMPHTISVKTVQLIKCRVHLPDINVLHPTINTWNVDVDTEFDVGNVDLGESQALHLRSVGEPSIRLHNFNLSFASISIKNSSVVKEFVLSGCSLTMASSVVVENVVIFGGLATAVEVSQTSFSSGSHLLLSNVTAVRFVQFSSLALSSNSSIELNHSNFNEGISVTSSTFDSDCVFSLDSSSAKAAWNKNPLSFIDVMFIQSSLCIARSTIVGGNLGGIKFSATNFINVGTYIAESNAQIFANGSKFSISDSVIDASKGYSLFNYYQFKPDKSWTTYRSRVFFGSVGGDSLGTTMLLHNSSVGKLPLLNVRGNFTAFVDSHTLQLSRLRFTGQATTPDEARESTVHIPPQATVRQLVLQGVSLQWDLHRALEAPLQSTGLPPLQGSGTLSTRPPLLEIEVLEGLELKEPLELVLDNQRMLLTPPPSMPNATAIIDVHFSDVSNASSVFIRGFEAASSIAVGGRFSGGSKVAVVNCTATDSIRTHTSTFTEASSLSIQNAVAETFIAIDGSSFFNESIALIRDSVALNDGVRLQQSNWLNKSQVHIQNATAVSTAHGLHLYNAQIVGEGSLMNVEDSSFTTTSISAHPMLWATNVVVPGKKWHRLDTIGAGATARLSHVRFRGANPLTWTNYGDCPPRQCKQFSFIAGDLVLEDVDFGGEGVRLYGRDGSVSLGAGIVRLRQLHLLGADSDLGGTQKCELGCTAESNTSICSSAILTDDVEDVGATAAAGSLKKSTALLNAAAAKIENVADIPLSTVDTDLLDRVQFMDSHVAQLARSACSGARTLPELNPSIQTNTNTHSTLNTKSTSLTLSTQPPLSSSTTMTTPNPVSARTTTFLMQPSLPMSQPTTTYISSSLEPTAPTTPVQSLPSTVEPPPTGHVEQPTEQSATYAPHNATADQLSKKRIKVTTSVMLPGNEGGAVVVVSVAGGANAAVSTLGSGGAGVIVVAGSAVRMMECGLVEDDPRPPRYELPIQFALGGSNVKHFVGAVLSHTLVQMGVFISVLVLHRHKQATAVKYLSLVFCGSHGFFTPTILGACSTVLMHSGGDGMSVGIGLVCSVVILALHAAVSLAVHFAPKNGIVAKKKKQQGSSPTALKLDFVIISSGSSSTSEASSSDSQSDVTPQAWLYSGPSTNTILITLYDGCNVFEKASHRHYATVETTLASIISIISGARPSSSCDSVALVLALLAAAGMMYVLVVRPFRTRLDTFFSILNNMTLVVLCAAVAVSLQRDGSDGDPSSWATNLMAGCLWLISAVAIIQLVVQGYWAYHTTQRRMRLNDDESSEDSDIELGSEGSLSSPLLVVADDSAEHHIEAEECSDDDDSHEKGETSKPDHSHGSDRRETMNPLQR